jgi:hypothetical protein
MPYCSKTSRFDLKEERKPMSNSKMFLLTIILGTVAGGIIGIWATRALPKIIEKMMQNMCAMMAECGCNPAEICQSMTTAKENPVPDERCPSR